MNFAIILSGGTGSRLKGIDLPKQYYKVCGRTILSYCMESIGRSGDLDAYVVVAAEEWRGTILQEMQELFSETSFVRKKFQGFASPGENRQLSVLSGLYALQGRAEETDIVLVQDAARPLTSAGLIGRCMSQILCRRNLKIFFFSVYQCDRYPRFYRRFTAAADCKHFFLCQAFVCLEI